MTESKKYITSKSKTFKEGSELMNIVDWVSGIVDSEFVVITDTPPDAQIQIQKKYKITITNLNE